MNTFYKVRLRGAKSFLDTRGRFNTADYFPVISEKGQRYDTLKSALLVAERWDKHRGKLYSNYCPCEVVQYLEEVLEIGTISKRGKLSLSLNQIET